MKKPSDASSTAKPHNPTVFFIDRSLGNIEIAAALRQAGEIAEIHDDHFPIDAKDEEWLQSVGELGWIVLTKDKKIRYRTPALIAIKKLKVGVFTLIGGELQSKEMAQIFIKALPKMKKLLSKVHPPFIAKVTSIGNVIMWTDFIS